jgi:hypothetical protein
MPEKGRPVFLDYDQAALDAAYDQAAYAPNRGQLIKCRIRDSELARHPIGEPERVAYGSAEIERLDIYRCRRKLTPVFIFIHGGAWRSGRSTEFNLGARRAPNHLEAVTKLLSECGPVTRGDHCQLAFRVVPLMRSAVVVFKSLNVFGFFEHLAITTGCARQSAHKRWGSDESLDPDKKHHGNMIHADS